MMNARARGALALRAGRTDLARSIIDSAIEAIHAFYREHDREEAAAESSEINFLQSWRAELDGPRTDDGRVRLREQLGLAVEREDYEEAARIRDVLRGLETRLDAPPPGPATPSGGPGPQGSDNPTGFA
jgi:hypothetical protein